MTKKNRNEVVRPRTVNKEWAEIGRRVREAMAPAGFHTQSALKLRGLGRFPGRLHLLLLGDDAGDLGDVHGRWLRRSPGAAREDDEHQEGRAAHRQDRSNLEPEGHAGIFGHAQAPEFRTKTGLSIFVTDTA